MSACRTRIQRSLRSGERLPHRKAALLRLFGTPLDLILRRLGVDTVILAGTTTPNCIRTSCYDALSLDYDAIVLSDCTSSVTEEVQRANLGDMERIGAQIETVEGLRALLG